MSGQPQERFNLSEFVLGYLEEAGSVVMPPEFGIYEVLITDELAKTLAIDEYARLTFDSPTPETAKTEALRLGISHPLVETIAQGLSSQPANIRTYLRDVRIDKRGLAELARKHFRLPNSRIDALPTGQEEATQHHYLLCNFKATILSEEKQEELVAVVMDLQAGHSVIDEHLYQRLAILDTTPAYQGLPVAPPRWPGTGDALALERLQALLPRAAAALQQQLKDRVSTLATRMAHNLSLDLARISDYYDEMAIDLHKRQGRLMADDERRQEFDDKLRTLQAERAAKLADATSRYQLRVEAELINVLLATQPKVVLPMTISNRTANITRTVVWDPLLHRLEPLVCDVCGEPGEALHLCTGGHLAHEACLAPQCIDCKREFCRLCAVQISECVVCRRPVCSPSLIKCPTCGRGTCHEHQQLCHAAAGEPALLPERTPVPPIATSERTIPRPPAETKPPLPAVGRRNHKSTPKMNTGKATAGTVNKGRPTKTALPTPIAKGVRIDVQVHEDRPFIVAFVMKSTNRVLAARSFELTPQGLLVHCQCEKATCPAHGYYHRPAAPSAILTQIETQLRALQQEYLIPAKKVNYYILRHNQLHEEKQLKLSNLWHDPTRLAEATRGFDSLPDK